MSLLKKFSCRHSHIPALDTFYRAGGLEDYPNVIQTLGSCGCLIKSENMIIPPITVKAVDTTGAGDTFNGALASELSMNKSIAEAVRTAVRASGLSVTKKRAVSSIPKRKDVEEF